MSLGVCTIKNFARYTTFVVLVGLSTFFVSIGTESNGNGEVTEKMLWKLVVCSTPTACTPGLYTTLVRVQADFALRVTMVARYIFVRQLVETSRDLRKLQSTAKKGSFFTFLQ